MPSATVPVIGQSSTFWFPLSSVVSNLMEFFSRRPWKMEAGKRLTYAEVTGKVAETTF
jgi:hypothetical protein